MGRPEIANEIVSRELAAATAPLASPFQSAAHVWW